MLGYQARLGLLDAITAEHLHDHHQATHTASNLRFYAIGAFDDGGTALAEELDRIAGHLPAGSPLQPNQARGLHSPDPIVVQQDIDSVYYEFAAYFGDTTQHQRQALDLLEVLLTGTWASRIFGQARRDGLAYHVASSPSTELGYGEFEISGYVSPSNLPRLFDLIAQQLGAMANGELDEQELTAAKAYATGSTTVRLQTLRALHTWYAPRFDIDGEICDVTAYLAGLRSLTVDDVAGVARMLLGSGRRGLSLVGPVNDGVRRDAGDLLLAELR